MKRQLKYDIGLESVDASFFNVEIIEKIRVLIEDYYSTEVKALRRRFNFRVDEAL